jgi:hypothetical protein
VITPLGFAPACTQLPLPMGWPVAGSLHEALVPETWHVYARHAGREGQAIVWLWHWIGHAAPVSGVRPADVTA